MRTTVDADSVTMSTDARRPEQIAREQDILLAGLEKSLDRVAATGVRIHTDIAEGTTSLDAWGAEVDSTHSRLRGASKETLVLSRNGPGTAFQIAVVLVLIAVVAFLTYFAFS